MDLGTADLSGEARPTLATAVERHTGRIDQVSGAVELTAQRPLRPLHQSRKKIGEHAARPMRIGIGEGRTPHWPDPQMIEPRPMTAQTGLDLAQARRAGKLSVDHRHKLCLRGEPALVFVGSMHFDQSLEFIPRKMLQHGVKYGILMSHGIVPFRVPERAQRPNTNTYSAVRIVKHKMCRTAVGSSRSSTKPSRRGWPEQVRP